MASYVHNTTCIKQVQVGNHKTSLWMSSAHCNMKAATVPSTAYNWLQRTRHVSRLWRTDNSVPEFTQVDWSRADDPTILSSIQNTTIDG